MNPAVSQSALAVSNNTSLLDLIDMSCLSLQSSKNYLYINKSNSVMSKLFYFTGKE